LARGATWARSVMGSVREFPPGRKPDRGDSPPYNPPKAPGRCLPGIGVSLGGRFRRPPNPPLRVPAALAVVLARGAMWARLVAGGVRECPPGRKPDRGDSPPYNPPIILGRGLPGTRVSWGDAVPCAPWQRERPAIRSLCTPFARVCRYWQGARCGRVRWWVASGSVLPDVGRTGGILPPMTLRLCPAGACLA